MKRCVVDAAPLIFLTKLGHLDILRLSASEVLVPQGLVLSLKAELEKLKWLGFWIS